jgi:hypothetical protein
MGRYHSILIGMLEWVPGAVHSQLCMESSYHPERMLISFSVFGALPSIYQARWNPVKMTWKYPKLGGTTFFYTSIAMQHNAHDNRVLFCGETYGYVMEL